MLMVNVFFHREAVHELLTDTLQKMLIVTSFPSGRTVKTETGRCMGTFSAGYILWFKQVYI
jgi:hypothetical protein